MNNIMSVFSAIILLFSAFFSGLPLQTCDNTAPVKNETIEINLYENQNGDLKINSSLLQDYELVFDQPGFTGNFKSVLSLSSPYTFSVLMRSLLKASNGWAEEHHIASTAGIYTSDVFESATAEKEIWITAAETDPFFQSISQKYTEEYRYGLQMPSDQESIVTILNEWKKYMFGKDASFLIKIYDNDQYMIINVMNDKGIIMTVSADYSEAQTITVIIGKAQNQVYYYQKIQCLEAENDPEYIIELRRGSEPSYQSSGNLLPVYTNHLRFNVSDNQYDYQMEIQSIILNSPFSIQGSVKVKENGIYEIDAEIPDEASFAESQKLHAVVGEITAAPENNNLKELSLSNPAERIQALEEILHGVNETKLKYCIPEELIKVAEIILMH